MTFTDLGKSYGLTLETAALNHGPPLATPDSSLPLAKCMLDRIPLGQTSFAEALGAGEIRIEGNASCLAERMALIQTPPFWFSIVTP